ncbi:hypothetical protein GCM10022254_04220 [Actinomadura meridiana]|uniref:Transposase n=1 Tax=Actinomadura meridiana TaxID=559626 RepID=A0ABP8BS69_9ACTN
MPLDFKEELAPIRHSEQGGRKRVKDPPNIINEAARGERGSVRAPPPTICADAPGTRTEPGARDSAVIPHDHARDHLPARPAARRNPLP